LEVTIPIIGTISHGLDLQQHIANDRANMPIILITGYGDIR